MRRLRTAGAPPDQPHLLRITQPPLRRDPRLFKRRPCGLAARALGAQRGAQRVRVCRAALGQLLGSRYLQESQDQHMKALWLFQAPW